MSYQLHRQGITCSVAILIALLATSAHADYSVGQNIAFTANGKNPWGPGPAQEVSDSYTLLDVPYTHLDIGPINGNPVDAALDAVAEALGISLPSVVKLKVGGSLSGSAHVGVNYFASLGRLNINYPGRASLDLQTFSSGDPSVRANIPYSIHSHFAPGVNLIQVSEPSAIGIGGAGYGEPLLSGLTMTKFSDPKFVTKPPWAQAQLVADADVHVGVYAQVRALFGLIKARKDYNFGGPVGGTLVEVDPTGLYVAGEEQLGVDLTAPYTFNIPGGTATAQLPQLGTTGTQIAPGSRVLHADSVAPVFTVDGDLEKLIPFIGSVLHNSFGPFDYNLLHLGGGPVISVYQDQTFTPDPQVRLTFSEPVIINGQKTNVTEFALGHHIDWTPLFANSDHVTIVPQYILKNTFSNETGLDLSLQVNVDAVSISAPFIPGGPPDGHTLGPLIKTTETIPLGRIPLPFINRDPWEINLGNVSGAPIVVSKANFNPGLEDIHLTAKSLISGTSSNGPATYDLTFTQTISGGPPKQFQATVSGTSLLMETDIPCLGSGAACEVGTVKAGIFTALQDVVLTDPVNGQHYNLGKDFCLYDCNLSAGLPAQSPTFVAEDPEHPGQFLPPLYVPHLADIPNTDVDVPNHPILGQQNTTYTNGVTQVSYATGVEDPRNEAVTTILVQSIDIVPEGDGIYKALSKAQINNSGNVAVLSPLATFAVPDGGFPAWHLVNESSQTKIVRVNDPLPGGGTLDLGNAPFSQVNRVNASGEIAFQANGGEIDRRGVYRAGANGMTKIARQSDLVPGSGYFYFPEADIPTPINNAHQVAFATSWSSTPGGAPTAGFGIFRGDGGPLTEIASVGIDPLGNTGIVTQIIDKIDINDSGYVSFLAQTTLHPNFGVYRSNGPSFVAIALPGGPAPFGSTFQAAYSGVTPKINSSGQVAFVGGVLTSLASSATAVYRGNGSQLTQIAIAGQFGTPAPDQDGILAALPIDVQVELNDAGQVAFAGSIAGAANYNAIFRGDGTELRRVARSGQTAPDGDGVFQYFYTPTVDGFRLNNQGHVAFVSTLINTTHDQGIFVYDGANVVQVIRNGKSLDGSTVTSFGAPSLNDAMQVAYTAKLADGREVAARFEPVMFWRNLGSGGWGTGANWSLPVEPTNPYDVFIVAENALTVTGPAINRTVKSLSIGGEDTAAATLNLVAGTTLSTTNGTVIQPNGVLTGFGALGGSLINDGTIRPGDNTTITTMALGDVLFDAAGKLELDIKGTTPGSQFDRLALSSSAHMGGELSIVLGGGFNPLLNNTFQLLTAAGGVSGQFDMAATQLPTLASGLGWLLRYNPNEVTLKVVSKLIGDFNSNGSVGPEDYNVWAANFGSMTKLSADANGNGIIDAGDYAIWRDHFGQTAGSGSNAANTMSPAVPEPPSALLLLLAVAFVSNAAAGRRQFVS